MNITGTNLGKKFGSHWIFKNLSFEIKHGESIALIGPNGSGKSTLLQILCSALTPSKGDITYDNDGNSVPAEIAIHEINFASPYTELIEELTLSEHLSFQSKFKDPINTHSWMAEQVGLQEAMDKPISQFSSGMKQRVKLALLFFYQSDILALDEPTANLDDKGKEIYQTEIRKVLGEKTILIASNDRLEYDFCEKSIDLQVS